MDVALVEVKEKLERALDILENFNEDTTPERIRARRVALGFLERDTERIKNLVSAYPVAVKQYIQELSELFYDYFHYFDLGYRALSGIDELGPALREKIKKGIEKLNLL